MQIDGVVGQAARVFLGRSSVPGWGGTPDESAPGPPACDSKGATAAVVHRWSSAAGIRGRSRSVAACGDPVRVEQTEVFDVEAVQYPPVAGGATQMVFVASTDHPAVQSGQNVDAPRAQVFLLFFRSWFSFLYVLVSLRNWFGASPNVARCRVGISNDQEPHLRFVGVPLVQSQQQPDFLPKYFWSTRFHGMAGWNLRR